jgi:hypothetical protein
MPLQHGCRFDEYHGVDGLRPNSVEPDPEQSVRIEELRASQPPPLQDSQLMPQSDHLKLKRGAATKAEGEERSDGGQKGEHQRMRYGDKAENLSHWRHL